MIQVEIGFWLTRDGKIVEITSFSMGQWPWVGKGLSYSDKGCVGINFEEEPGDLVVKLSKETYPEYFL